MADNIWCPKPMTIGPIGSRGAMLTCYFVAPDIGAPLVGGPWVRTGCFTGTLEDFSAAVVKAHGENEHGQMYFAAIAFLQGIAEQHEQHRQAEELARKANAAEATEATDREERHAANGDPWGQHYGTWGIFAR